MREYSEFLTPEEILALNNELPTNIAALCRETGWGRVSAELMRKSAFSKLYEEKRAALNNLSGSEMDGQKRLTMRRIAPGKYVYSPRGCDSGAIERDKYVVERVTSENIGWIKGILENTEAQAD